VSVVIAHMIVKIGASVFPLHNCLNMFSRVSDGAGTPSLTRCIAMVVCHVTRSNDVNKTDSCHCET